MNKNELIAHVADEAGLSKADASRAVESVLNGITETLKSGDEVRLVGFGTFTLSHREGGEGRNPRTGEKIQIQPSKSVRFKAGKQLKDSVN
jgi:DNA-binding protein HU-beta